MRNASPQRRYLLSSDEHYDDPIIEKVVVPTPNITSHLPIVVPHVYPNPPDPFLSSFPSRNPVSTCSCSPHAVPTSIQWDHVATPCSVPCSFNPGPSSFPSRFWLTCILLLQVLLCRKDCV